MVKQGSIDRLSGSCQWAEVWHVSTWWTMWTVSRRKLVGKDLRKAHGPSKHGHKNGGT